MTAPTLKKRVSQISAGAFIMAIGIILAGFFVFSAAKRSYASREVLRDLKRNSAAQMEQLIPSFLLPEQSAGVDLLLSRIGRDDDLTHAIVLHSKSDLPEVFRACDLGTSESVCSSIDGRETALVIPIAESGKVFGYLLKAKHNNSSWAINDIVQLFGMMALLLLFAFSLIYLFVIKLLARTLPSALDRLVAWVSADLSGKSEAIAPLPFSELETLREKISEVMDRHARDRDQAVIGQLTSGIMHDIKTPLHSVVTATHLVEKYPAGHPKRLARLENLATVCRDTLPIVGRIIETTLDGSRQIHISKEDSDLVCTVKEALALNQSLANLRRATVELNAPEALSGPHDPVQVIRVLTNLLKNAIEASESHDPKIAISVSRSDVDAVTISVEDNGPGLRASSDKVFRVFRSSKVHGSGLGLHVSRKIIEAHHGTIRATNRSRLGGARFDVQLPMSDSPGVAG